MIEIISRLPSDYQEVAYIESTGTQYIKTKFVPSYSTRVVMRATVTDHSANGAFFGARTSSSLSGLSYSLILLAGGTVRSDYYGTEVNVTTAQISQEITIDKNKNVCTINGATATNTASTSSSAYPLYLFAANTAGTASLFGKFRLPETQIYDNGTLKLHYIPCYRKSDMAAGVYDLVNDEFEGNSGSGEFNVGANVSEIIITAGGVIGKKWALRRRIMMFEAVGAFEFEYTGNYTDNRDANGIGTVEFTSSGTLTVLSGAATVSVYILAGGGGAAMRPYNDSFDSTATGGGGGNQTIEVMLEPGTYDIVIGTGGAPARVYSGNTAVKAGTGGNTVAFNTTSTGGTGGEFTAAYGIAGKGGTPNGEDGVYSYYVSTAGGSLSGGSPNGGSMVSRIPQPGGNGLVRITFS